jgi:hypothetical protein
LIDVPVRAVECLLAEYFPLRYRHWRLVAIHVEQTDAERKVGIPVPSSTLEQKLESFVVTSTLIKALAAGDKPKGMQLFKEFYDDTPGIYSVRWMDKKGINRFGYPRANSLADYN